MSKAPRGGSVPANKSGGSQLYEEKFTTMEEERSDALEVAAQEDQAQEETARQSLRLIVLSIFSHILYYYILSLMGR